MNISNVEFLTSAATEGSFPKARLPEIAFAGKSNVGKSSVINCILRRKNIARVGEKPGKTIHVNYFIVDKKCYFVDLPGYGYAKVSQAEKDRWGRLMEDYFASERIDLGVFIVDARHAPTQNDIVMARWFIESGCPFVVVANKLDKLKKSEIEPNMQQIRDVLNLPDGCVVVPFSAEKGTGRDELLKIIESVAEK
jgi:GTP-binding protein